MPHPFSEYGRAAQSPRIVTIITAKHNDYGWLNNWSPYPELTGPDLTIAPWYLKRVKADVKADCALSMEGPELNLVQWYLNRWQCGEIE